MGATMIHLINYLQYYIHLRILNNTHDLNSNVNNNHDNNNKHKTSVGGNNNICKMKIMHIV